VFAGGIRGYVPGGEVKSAGGGKGAEQKKQQRKGSEKEGLKNIGAGRLPSGVEGEKKFFTNPREGPGGGEGGVYGNEVKDYSSS